MIRKSFAQFKVTAIGVRSFHPAERSRQTRVFILEKFSKKMRKFEKFKVKSFRAIMQTIHELFTERS